MAGSAAGKDLYELLGVSRDCDIATLKSAWRARALENHPDKGGDEAIFKQVQEAYEILSNPRTRSLYDAHGHDGLAGGFGGFGSMFGGGFGGGFGGSKRRKPHKGKSITYELKLSLEQLFSGTCKKVAVHRDVICSDCNGSGNSISPAPEPGDCPGCGGTGARTDTKSHGRGMMQRAQVVCVECGGSGKNIPEAQRCLRCNGRRVIQQCSEVEVEVEAGTRHKTKLTIDAMGDEVAETGGKPGDLVITVWQLDHDIFVRKGDDLVLQRKLTLREALCGCTVDIQHLDGRRLLWKSIPGQVIEHGLVRCIEGEGFPQTAPKQPRGQPSQPPGRKGKGRLLIRFEVEFPSAEALTNPANSDLQVALDAALPPTPHVDRTTPFGVDTAADTPRHHDWEKAANAINESDKVCVKKPVVCVLEKTEIDLEDTKDEAYSATNPGRDGQQCNQQ